MSSFYPKIMGSCCELLKLQFRISIENVVILCSHLQKFTLRMTRCSGKKEVIYLSEKHQMPLEITP